MSPDLKPAPLPKKPYRGPKSFRLIDSPIFRARDSEIAAVLQKITIYRGVAIYGDQGAGKSSFINAGIIPKLLDRKFVVDRIRIRATPGTEGSRSRGEIVVERLAAGEAGPPSSLIREDEKQLTVTLTLAEFEERLRAAQDSPRVLIFDQFEEIITNFPSSLVAQQDSIVKLLVRLCYDQTLAVKLVLVFREDYLAKIADLLAAAPDLMSQPFWLRPPKKELALQIIRGPFDSPKNTAAFSRPNPSFTNRVMKLLAEELQARDPDRERDPDRLNLTDLQIACLELWQAKDPEGLLEDLHVHGLIEAYLNRALEKLARKDLKGPAILLLGYMITPLGTRNVISESDAISSRYSSSFYSPETLKKALDALVATRLVRREKHDNSNYYDIVSEFLGRWVANTRRKSDSENTALSARSAARNARFMVLGVGVALLLFLGALLFRTYTNAQNNQVVAQLAVTKQTLATAESRRSDAETIVRLLSQQKQQPKNQKGANMFGSTVLEIGIGLALLYLLLSLICSVVNEGVSSVFASRARHLRAGIGNLFRDEDLLGTFYRHPLIQALTLEAEPPSYIPDRFFSLALLDVIASGAVDFNDIKPKLQQLKSTELSKVLSIFHAQSKTIEDLHTKIQQWFNDSMDAVSGSFKRRTQIQVAFIGLILTIVLNVNTLNVIHRLSQDTAVRASIVAQAEAVVSKAGTDSSSDLKNMNATQQLQSLGLPIGWTLAEVKDTFRISSTLFSNLLGWLVTALAVSLGAPFWFDLLGRFMVVRSAVKPKENLSSGDSQG
jgi:hypothetical protein